MPPQDSKYAALFEPIRIGPKVLPNRFFQTAHCMGAGSERPAFQASFRAMKAEGGWGAVSTEYCSVSPESDDADRVSARIWDDDDAANLGAMCEAVHAHGALAAIELWHGGPTAKCLESRVPPLAPVHMPAVSGAVAATCKGMDGRDLARVVREYADAAARAQRAGFDVVTVHVTHAGSLPHLFLMPEYNRRTDDYGGSFENRSRLAREIVEAVRAATGGGCAIAVRFGIDTLDRPHGHGDGGIRARDDGARFVEALDDLVDFWDLTVGGLEWGEDAGPSRTHRENHEAAWVAVAKAHTSKPTMNVGRFTNPDTMLAVIRSGQADVIGAARPSIADPFLPQKIREGRLGEIRECIGCNVCISRWEVGGPPIVCTQNAVAGEEFRRGWHPERFTRAANADRDVLVVGAGPSGMECAIVLGKRGMRRVHLVDRAGELGGQLVWVPQLPGLGEWGRVTDYRKHQIELLDSVTFVPRTAPTAEEILAYGAEIVVIATGSEWARSTTVDGLDAALPHVLTPEQLLVEGKPLPDGRVAVYDADGYFVAPGIAERLALKGREVVYVTPHPVVSPYTQLTLEGPRLNRRLRELGVAVHTERELHGARDGGLLVAQRWHAADVLEVPCDAVVLVTHREPRDDLYRQLAADAAALEAAGIEGVFQIGDCVAPGLIADAVFSGHRLAREIDSPDPAVPLPYLRERPPVRLRLVTDTAAEVAAAAR